jgi:hypothetical protein
MFSQWQCSSNHRQISALGTVDVNKFVDTHNPEFSKTALGASPQPIDYLGDTMPKPWGGDLSPLCQACIRLVPLHPGLTGERRDATIEVFPKLQRSIDCSDGSIPFPR